MKNITYISASAGSGKTYELTERLKNVILNNKCKPEEVILTTFTVAAAAEFKEKAKAKFYAVGKTKEANRLDQALIGTVDSVANVFVNRYWYLLGLSPKQKVISTDEEQVYISESLSSIPTPAQNEFFSKFAETFRIPEKHEDNKKYGINYNYWKDDLKKIFDASRSYSIKDFADSLKASKELIKRVSMGYSKLNFNRDDLLEKLDALDAISNADKPSVARDTRISETEKFRRLVKNPETSQIEIGFGLVDLISKGDFSSKVYKNSDDYLSLELESDKIWTCEDVRDLQFTYIEYLFDVAARWKNQYCEYKKEQQILDYTDMEEYFFELISKPEFKTVQDDITASYKYLFVDEFQDCSPTQIKIFDRLSELVEQTIWVGDYKQSIYGFRGSDTALVKAVTDRIEKLNGHPNDTLGFSHRSWTPLVKFSNKIFVPAFSDLLSENEVKLEPWPEINEEYEKSGRKDLFKYWPVNGIYRGRRSNGMVAEQVAPYIAQMIKNGIAPKDIAVLARTVKELTTLSTALKGYNIPVLVGDSAFKASDEIILLNSLLSLVVNSYDTMARAQIAYLTEEGYNAASILDKRFENISKNLKDGDYLSEIPLIQELMAKRNKYRSMSISALVESIIIEMDLYNVVKSWPDSENSVNTFHTAIGIAKAYEDHCIQMSLPCTIYGFIDYITTVDTKAAGMSDGVQLFTYHGSKGLEWNNVILLSLDDDILDEDDMIGWEYYGVQTFHENAPDADNPYPPMMISVLPWIFGTKTKVPQVVKDLILVSPEYKRNQKETIKEEKRLMYVAVTRAKYTLTLVENGDKPLKRFECMGINLPDIFKEDVLDDMEDWKYKIPEKKVFKLYAPKEPMRNRDQQPSSYKSNAKVSANIIFDSAKRINLNAGSEIMNKVGTCIHDIYCVLEKNPTVEQVQTIINNHQRQKELSVALEILDAWKELEKFLTQKYGVALATYHELPFTQAYDGQIFTGSIDFVWETKEGVVLVDFKSYAGTKNDVVTPTHKHFAGIYAGQFECYERALKEAKKNVLAKVVYYPVIGVGVELK